MASYYLCLPWNPTSASLPRMLLPSGTRTKHGAAAHRAHYAITSAQSLDSFPPRRSGNFQPNLWDNNYIQSLNNDDTEENAQRIEKLKEDVKHLISEEKELLNKLELVDNLTQLGVAYHFENEIKDVIETIHRSIGQKIGLQPKEDLYAMGLFFRLLREHGYDLSQDVFESFKDEKGSFKACLCHDTKGLLSLYEASYLAMEGENILDEAREFTTKYLNKQLLGISLDQCLRKHVAYALELPLHWRMKRLHSRWFIDTYESKGSRNHVLLELAKRDFNKVQSTHKRELKNMSRWWSNLGLRDKLSFARERLVENYYWALGWTFEPEFGSCRETVTQVISFVTTIDDIYDVYGSLDELEQFTSAVDRWDISVMDELPEYMKICFLALFNTSNEIAYDILKTKGVDVSSSLKRSWANQCRAFLVEAKWYYKGYKPTLKEYLANAWISVAGPIIMIHVYVWMSQEITKEALEWFESGPDIIRHSSVLLRLYDDLGTWMYEVKRGDVPKTIQLYEHEEGVSDVIAQKHIRDLVYCTWKKLNANCFAEFPCKETFINVAMNTPRISQCVYQYGDGYGEPHRETKDRITSLLIEPVSLNM